MNDHAASGPPNAGNRHAEMHHFETRPIGHSRGGAVALLLALALLSFASIMMSVLTTRWHADRTHRRNLWQLQRDQSAIRAARNLAPDPDTAIELPLDPNRSILVSNLQSTIVTTGGQHDNASSPAAEDADSP